LTFDSRAILKGFLSGEIEASGFFPDGKVEVDIGPEIFVDHHPDSEADSRFHVFEQLLAGVGI
jgi:hypothetical protein